MSDTQTQMIARAIPVHEVDGAGYLVDPETGEVLGHLTIREQFVPDTEDKVEWVLERMQRAEADLLALEMRRAAILKLMDAEIAAARRRVDWLNLRFLEPLRAFTERVLAGKKGRSHRTPYGILKLTRRPSRIEIADHDAAVRWAKSCLPDAVVTTEKVTLTSFRAAWEASPVTTGLPEFIQVVPESVGFKVDTCVRAPEEDRS